MNERSIIYITGDLEETPVVEKAKRRVRWKDGYVEDSRIGYWNHGETMVSVHQKRSGTDERIGM